MFILLQSFVFFKPSSFLFFPLSTSTEVGDVSPLAQPGATLARLLRGLAACMLGAGPDAGRELHVVMSCDQFGRWGVEQSARGSFLFLANSRLFDSDHFPGFAPPASQRAAADNSSGSKSVGVSARQLERAVIYTFRLHVPLNRRSEALALAQSATATADAAARRRGESREAAPAAPPPTPPPVPPPSSARAVPSDSGFVIPMPVPVQVVGAGKSRKGAAPAASGLPAAAAAAASGVSNVSAGVPQPAARSAAGAGAQAAAARPSSHNRGSRPAGGAAGSGLSMSSLERHV